ncbi:MAG: amidohydrolase family protein [Acidobacteria bacterium]|nr:amidohydrolase family protein [Acidobacteriota bacterium]
MKHRYFVRCVLAGLAVLAALAALESQVATLAVIRATVVDVVDGRLMPNATVVITGRTITSVTTGGAPPAGVTVVDGAGTFLIPSLWDMHAHMETAGEPWLQLYVANGVTGIRDMGSDLDLILRMLAARPRGIEHLSEGRIPQECSSGNAYRPDACRPLFERLARDGVWQTPTLMARLEAGTIGTPASGIDSEQLVYVRKAMRDQWAAVQKAFITPTLVGILKTEASTWAVVTRDMARLGVGILAGCDGLIAGFCVHDELAMMVRGGMTPLAALQTATINPARYFGIENTAGSIAAGKRADLVLLDGNPLEDIANVRRIHAVVVAGRLLERKELDELRAQVKAAAAG